MENYLGSAQCSCGREHDVAIDDVVVGKGVIHRLPEFVEKYGAKKPFILADKNTYKAAGEAVAEILRGSGISFSSYVFQNDALEPDEEAVGSAIMHFDPSCDLIIGVDAEYAKLTFKATKDIRDKYVLSRLAWDLGILDELAERL